MSLAYELYVRSMCVRVLFKASFLFVTVRIVETVIVEYRRPIDC